MERAELITVALQQRIGEIVSNYEMQQAILRAEITKQQDKIVEMQKTIDEYSKIIQEKEVNQVVQPVGTKRVNSKN
jgi:hypothetical protein